MTDRIVTWQPIAIAPKDGTEILTFCPAAKKYGRRSIRMNYWLKDGWHRSNETFWPPTHWMPLPEPPHE